MEKFTKYGAKVLVIGEAKVGQDKGFIAKPIYTHEDCDDYEDDAEELDEAPKYYSSKELFDVAPTLMYDKRIAELKRNIAGLEMSYLDKSNKISDKMNEINTAERRLYELKNMLPEFAKHPILEMIYRYVMGEFEWVFNLENLEITAKGQLRLAQNFEVRKEENGLRYLLVQYSENLDYHDKRYKLMVFATKVEAETVAKNRVISKLKAVADQKPKFIQEYLTGASTYFLQNDKEVTELRERLVKSATERENKIKADQLKKEIEAFEAKKKELEGLTN